MGDILTLPGGIFVGYVVGYGITAACLPSVLREEGIELPPAGYALVAFLLTAWPLFLALSILDSLKRRRS